MANTAHYLKGLNAPQRTAVETTDGPVMVLAGAGSGKTRVITQRIAYLIGAGKAEPEEILAVTFTNKAAAEMRERVAELVGQADARRITVSTFHSFCVRVLREHCEIAGYRRNFTISSESDTRLLMRRIIDDMEPGGGYSPATFLAQISLHKNADAKPGDLRPKAKQKVSATEAKYDQQLTDVFDRYQSALRAANSVDFDDLLLLVLRLWRDNPALLERYQQRYRYVMVDEYQDTNRVQYQLVRMLVDAHRNLCVVGDDDQSIYAWRGADVRNLLDFERDFKEAKIITLEQNYRSTQTILAAANAVISNNRTRRAKNLWSQLGKGRPLEWFVTGDEEDEAKHAVAQLKHIIKHTGAAFSDFAVLYRSNQQSRPFEIAFRQAGIPYVVIGGQEFFERAEVKDIVSYFKLIANPRDEAAFLRVVNMPRRGIGDKTLHLIHDLCREEKVGLGKAIAEVLKRGLAPAQAKQGLSNFLGMVQHFRRAFREQQQDLQSLANHLVDATGYYAEIDRTSRNGEHATARRQNVQFVLEAIGEYEREADNPTLAGFLDASSLDTDHDRATKDARRSTGVTLMTIHSAKGLEFPFVFLAGLEDGLLPHERSLNENQLDEERRLFYVALTRGKRHVTLFEACARTRNGKARVAKSSRFLKEIPPEFVNQRIMAARDMVEARIEPNKDRPKRKAKPRKRKVVP
ncbi:MAG: ATP-dependent helicase [Candidatus Hydrogenedentota bacterium]